MTYGATGQAVQPFNWPAQLENGVNRQNSVSCKLLKKDGAGDENRTRNQQLGRL